MGRERRASFPGRGRRRGREGGRERGRGGEERRKGEVAGAMEDRGGRQLAGTCKGGVHPLYSAGGEGAKMGEQAVRICDDNVSPYQLFADSW